MDERVVVVGTLLGVHSGIENDDISIVFFFSRGLLLINFACKIGKTYENSPVCGGAVAYTIRWIARKDYFLCRSKWLKPAKKEATIGVN